MTRVVLKGINKVRKWLSDGRDVQLHYLRDRRGAAPFWRPDSGVALGSPEYLTSYEAALGVSPAVARNDGKLRALVLEFYASEAFKKFAAKTKRDYVRGLADVEK